MIKVNWCSELVEIVGVNKRDYEREFAFQIYCADWIRKQFELTGNPSFDFWHHSANERSGGRAGLTAKLMGQAKGWPDFIHCGLRLVIELKILDGKLSVEQGKWLKYFSGLGWSSHVVLSFEDFRRIVEERILELAH